MEEGCRVGIEEYYRSTREAMLVQQITTGGCAGTDEY